MVRPCCENVYKKYILEDGTIDPKTLKNAFGFGASVIYKKEKHLNEYINVPYVRKFFLNSKICTCMCHRHNLNVVH